MPRRFFRDQVFLSRIWAAALQEQLHREWIARTGTQQPNTKAPRKDWR